MSVTTAGLLNHAPLPHAPDWAELLRRYDGNVPRYTSYPTANHFTPLITSETYADWIRAVPAAASLSLYLHVPFCKSMCRYCGCFTRVPQVYDPVSDYVQALREEIAVIAKILAQGDSDSPRPVSHIHWGGGTPTYLSVPDLRAVFETLRSAFEIMPDAEIAMEIDPRTVDAHYIAALADCGVTRASLGVQEFDPDVQDAIGRLQPFDVVRDCTHALRDNGIASLNFDMMYGLPLQTESTIRRTMDMAADLSPSRLAVFGYAHVPWVRGHQKSLESYEIPDSLARVTLRQTAEDALHAHGYHPIGIDHYAQANDPLFAALRAGTLHRNFQGYTTDHTPYLIGFGASAISALPQGYAQNTTHMALYKDQIRKNHTATARGLALDSEDRIRGDIIHDLMCFGQADLSVLIAHILPKDVQTLDNMLSTFEKDGLIQRRESTLTLTPHATPLARVICAAFDSWYDPETENRHAKAV